MLMHWSRNRSLALLALVPMVWFSIEGAAYSTAYRVSKQRQERIRATAERMGLDPGSVCSGLPLTAPFPRPLR